MALVSIQPHHGPLLAVERIDDRQPGQQLAFVHSGHGVGRQSQMAAQRKQPPTVVARVDSVWSYRQRAVAPGPNPFRQRLPRLPRAIGGRQQLLRGLSQILRQFAGEQRPAHGEFGSVHFKVCLQPV